MGPVEKRGAERLGALGISAVQIPVVKPMIIEEGFRRLALLLESHEGLMHLAFTSSLGASVVCRRLRKTIAARIAAGTLVTACIGPVTRKTLVGEGLECGIMPGKYTGRRLGEALCEAGARKVVLARSRQGLRSIVSVLEACGASVEDIHVYNAETLWDNAIKAAGLAAGGGVDKIFLTSPLIARIFAKALGKIGSALQDLCPRLVAIGPTTARQVEEIAVCIVPYPSEHSLAGMARMVGFKVKWR